MRRERLPHQRVERRGIHRDVRITQLDDVRARVVEDRRLRGGAADELAIERAHLEDDTVGGAERDVAHLDAAMDWSVRGLRGVDVWSNEDEQREKDRSHHAIARISRAARPGNRVPVLTEGAQPVRWPL